MGRRMRAILLNEMLSFKLILHSCVLSILCYMRTFKAEDIPIMNSVSSSMYARVIYPEPQMNSVSASIYANGLHHEIGNEDPPNATDPAWSSALVRRRICADITSNGIFYHALLLDSENPVRILLAGRAMNPDIFDVLFSETEQYTNPYSEREFEIWAPSPQVVKEHVFACPVRSLLNDTIFLYYVSKEYNVGSFHEPYMPGRFVFGSLQSLLWHSQVRSNYFHVMLAERPAKVFEEPGFNIERHYFRLREYTETADSDRIDPLCQLVPANLQDPTNQYTRICSAVCTSYSYDRARHVPHRCQIEQVSFRTIKNETLARGPYYERIVPCFCDSSQSTIESTKVYVSRAYQSNQLLVYRFHHSTGQLFLDDLSVNVNIVDELHSFDFIEE